MLNATQITELKKKKFYSSTYKILYNMHYYLDMKTHFSFSIASKSAVIMTVFKIIFCLFSFFNIKKFAKFRNENIEHVLNHEISLKSVIVKLESNSWLDVGEYDFINKIQAIRTSTYDIYSESQFIIEIQEVLNSDSDFDSDFYGEIFKKLLDDYDIIINAWTYCRNNDMLTINHLKNKYNELRDNSDQFSHNMMYGALTESLEDLSEAMKN